MSKIVKAYAFTTEAKKPSFDLLKEFNVSDAVGKLLGKKKPAAEAPPPTKPEEAAQQDNAASHLEAIATKVTQPTAGTVAFSLNLRRSDMKDHYLKTDGGQSLIDAIIQAPTDRKKFVAHPGDHLKMADITAHGNGDTIVLVYVPTVLAKKFQELTDQTVLEEVKKVLVEMLLHRYYVCSLFKARLQQQQQAIDAAQGDADALLAAFDPSVVFHWRNPGDLVKAKAEWANEHSGEAKTDKETSGLEKKATTADRRREAEKKIIGDTSDLENTFLQIVNQASDAESAANTLGGKINDSLPREQVLAVLSKINKSLASPKIAKIIELLSKTPDSAAPKEKPKSPEEQDNERHTSGLAMDSHKILGN